MEEKEAEKLIADKLKTYAKAEKKAVVYRKDFMEYLGNEHIKTKGVNHTACLTMLKVAGSLKVLW